MDHRKPKAKTMSRAERDARKLSEVIEILSEFTDVKVLADLYARGEEATGPDGFPSLSGGGSDIHGGRGGDPVEKTVEMLAGGKGDEPDTWEELRDVQLERISEFQGELASIHGSARLLRKASSVVLNAADRYRGRQDALQGPCLRCERAISGAASDRSRHGLCGTCSNIYYETRREGESVPDWLMRTRVHTRVRPVAGPEDFTPGRTFSA